MTLTIGSDPGTPVSHLCPPCSFGLTAYLSNDHLGAAEAAANLAKESSDGRQSHQPQRQATTA